MDLPNRRQHREWLPWLLDPRLRKTQPPLWLRGRPAFPSRQSTLAGHVSDGGRSRQPRGTRRRRLRVHTPPQHCTRLALGL